jgi:hypothetical protein
MSEMDYEEEPTPREVYVPRVRKWLGPALKDWRRGCYPRHGFTIIWGFFIPIWAIWQALKFAIYGFGVVIILVAYVFWVVAELLTYRHRQQRAALAAWAPYMGELQDPPQAA